MSKRNPIPRTTIQRYYQRVCKMNYAQRSVLARELIADPQPLVAEFTSGIEAFRRYGNPEGFYSNKNRAPKAPDPIGQITKTHHVAWYLREQALLEVGNTPRLNAEYLDYEIRPARTTNRAHFDDDGGSWRSGMMVDLLLVSSDNRTPIVGELKIRSDKDPFTALIQMLAGAVHLATRDQYERLRKFMPTGAFPPTEQPRLDGYVLLYQFLETPQADLETLDRHADELSALLMNHTAITTHLRRIACVDLELRADGKLHGSCRWQHGV
ncbi:MAG: hypothetical protein H0T97_12885 [Actinobacteria bacterium]|nr:hypothetical protein [Actinomycetota bacterium]